MSKENFVKNFSKWQNENRDRIHAEADKKNLFGVLVNEDGLVACETMARGDGWVNAVYANPDTYIDDRVPESQRCLEIGLARGTLHKYYGGNFIYISHSHILRPAEKLYKEYGGQ